MTDHIEASPINWTKKQVQDFASEVAQKLDYKAGGDVAVIVKNLGGKIEQTNWSSARHTGSVEVRGVGDFIINLSPNSGERRARFTIAHELGHYILHSQLGKIPLTIQRDGSDRLEWEANWFAAGFLMPEAEFRRVAGLQWSNAEIGEHFDVSEAAVSIRREALGC